MKSQDRCKLRRAGYRIFRMHIRVPTGARYSIWEYDHAWVKHAGFKTTAVMREAWKILMNDDLNIGDE